MALFIKVIFNVLLLFMFNTNLYGAVITNIIFAFVSAYLNLKSVKKITKFKFNVQKTFIYPTIASLIMGAIAFVTYHLTYLLVQRNAISTLFAIFIAFIVYGLFIIKLKAVDADEIKTLPKGAKIVALCNRIGLLN
jgi:stage V sporulation protein B